MYLLTSRPLTVWEKKGDPCEPSVDKQAQKLNGWVIFIDMQAKPIYEADLKSSSLYNHTETKHNPCSDKETARAITSYFDLFPARTHFPSSQIVLWRFSLFSQLLKCFIFHRELIQPTLELKWKGLGAAKRINGGRATNRSTSKDSSVEEEPWQRQRDTRPLIEYTKLWESSVSRIFFFYPLLH